jgi:ABC-type amino acid transport substrate-binding protein
MTPVERIEWRLRHDIVAEEGWRPETIARAIRARRAGAALDGPAHEGFFGRPVPILRPRLQTLPPLGAVLLIAAVLAILALLAGGPKPMPVETPSPSATTGPTLARIVGSGRLRVAVLGPVDSIHGAVAQAVARGLGVQPVLSEVERPAIKEVNWNDQWDVAVGVVNGYSIGESHAFVGEYGYRPAFLLVASDSTIAAPAELAGRVVCVREGGDPQTWITGFPDNTSVTTPVTLPNRDALTIVTRPSDTECLAALTAGAVDAAFEDQLTVTQLQAPNHRRLGGPAFTERLEFMVSRQDPHAAELRFPIGELLIHGLWIDGTLANVFAQHQDENVQAIQPSETPAPS